MSAVALDALDFDPYLTWLHVTDGERPVGPYQLLGIAPLEPDPNCIRAGYERRQAALLAQVETADRQLWESVSQEIEKAYNLLCDPEQKAVLDAAIRRRGGAGSGPVVAPRTGNVESITCRHCQRPNPPARRFCGGCGQSLWEACPQCRAECSADERFCGACGCDIRGGLGEQGQKLEARLAEGAELLAAYRYDAAISALRGVAAVSDPRFESYAQRALAEIKRIEDSRKSQAAANIASLTKAKEHLQACAFEHAVQSIEEIPVPLRTAEANDLLARAHASRKELLALGGEIRAALERKETADLLPKIARLLVLKPDHHQAKQIAEQLRDNLVKSAKQGIIQHRYRDALDTLERIPAYVRTGEVETLTDTAGELLALLDAVKLAPLADQITLALAERLVKLAPKNEEAAKLRAQLAEKVKAPPAGPRLVAPYWVPAPKRTLIGPPLDAIARFTRLKIASDEAKAVLDEQPSRMFVALGLALEGMGLASMPLDLMPQEKQGMLSMLPGASLLGKRGPSAAWGIDLSESGLKAIKLYQDPKPPKGQTAELEIAAAVHIPHSCPLTHPDAEMERGEITSATLAAFLAAAGDLKGCKVCINIPAQRVLGRFFELPPLAAKKVPDAIAFEARHQLPINLDELYWDSRTLDPVDAKQADDQPRRIMVVAARQAHVKDRLGTFKAAGIAVDQVQSDALALHNALAHELFAGEENQEREDAILSLDVGTDNTSVVVSSRRAVWFRTFGLGGDQFTAALIRQFKLTHDQAEELKREPARGRRFGQMQAALLPLFTQVAGEVERSLANYAKLYPDHPVTQAYGVGGAFATYGLLRHLRTGK